MSTGKKLRLGPLPKLESTKLTFACPVGLRVDLDRYAALHAQTYGEVVDAATLIPHIDDRPALTADIFHARPGRLPGTTARA